MFHAVRETLYIPEEFREVYTHKEIRRACVASMVINHEEIFKQYKDVLVTNYGLGTPGQPGPFSYVSYLKYMAEDGHWGDQVCLYALSLWFGARITVVDAVRLDECRIRHQRSLGGVDLVLVFNGLNHYFGAGKCTSKVRSKGGLNVESVIGGRRFEVKVDG